jgi:hypothetical protein
MILACMILARMLPATHGGGRRQLQPPPHDMVKTRSIENDDSRRPKAYRLLRTPHAGTDELRCVGPRVFAWCSTPTAAAIAQRVLTAPIRPGKRKVLHEDGLLECGLVNMDTTRLDPLR